MSLRLGKCWQGTTPFLVFQADANLASGVRWRGFLKIDLRPRTATVSLISQKPEDLLASGAIANLIRKYVPGGRVAGIIEHQELRDQWVAIHCGEMKFFQITGQSPPEFRLINAVKTDSDRTELSVMARLSTAGMFTKKQSFSHVIPDFAEGRTLPSPSTGCRDLMGPLLEGIVADSLKPPGNAPQMLQTPDGDKTTEPFPLFQREARDRLARRLKTLRKSALETRRKIPQESAAAQFEQSAHLLKSFSWLAKPGMLELNLDTVHTGLELPVSIPLDPEQTVGAQIDAFYVAAKKMRKGIALGYERERAILNEIELVEIDLAALRSTPLFEAEVERILEKHHLRQRSQSRTIRDLAKSSRQHSPTSPPKGMSRFRSFTSADGIQIYVGRTAIENDELTKAAKSNDWWIHAVGVHGSHIIIPAKSAGSQLQEKTLREAGILALHFSKFKENRAGEVYVTKKQNLRKQKGMAAGMWTVLRSETIMIRFDQDELDRIFKNHEAQAGT